MCILYIINSLEMETQKPSQKAHTIVGSFFSQKSRGLITPNNNNK